MVIWLADLPQHITVPVQLQGRATLVVAAPEIAIVGDMAIEKKGSPLGQVSPRTWRVRHVPAMDDVSLHVDEKGRITLRAAREEGKSLPCMLGVVRAQANSRTLHPVLFDW